MSSELKIFTRKRNFDFGSSLSERPYKCNDLCSLFQASKETSHPSNTMDEIHSKRNIFEWGKVSPTLSLEDSLCEVEKLSPIQPLEFGGDRDEDIRGGRTGEEFEALDEFDADFKKESCFEECCDQSASMQHAPTKSFIYDYFRKVTPPKIASCKVGEVDGESMSLDALCRCCDATMTGEMGFETCAYCARPSCVLKCLSVCEGCGHNFCKFCATINYDMSFERVMCLDCNSS